MFSKILLAYDGSEGAKRALEAGINLAKLHQAEIWAVSVMEGVPRFPATIDEVQEERDFAMRHDSKILDEAQARAREAGLELKTLRYSGHPAQTIVLAAQEGNFDLVLLGHSGISGVWAKFLGSTAEKVSRHAPCSVLIVR
jgi:nucleotide-binding universal stress UspA family protein